MDTDQGCPGTRRRRLPCLMKSRLRRSLPTLRSYASQRNMNMRVLGIEMGRRYPFETRAKIGLHL